MDKKNPEEWGPRGKRKGKKIIIIMKKQIEGIGVWLGRGVMGVGKGKWGERGERREGREKKKKII